MWCHKYLTDIWCVRQSGLQGTIWRHVQWTALNSLILWTESNTFVLLEGSNNYEMFYKTCSLKYLYNFFPDSLLQFKRYSNQPSIRFLKNIFIKYQCCFNNFCDYKKLIRSLWLLTSDKIRRNKKKNGKKRKHGNKGKKSTENWSAVSLFMSHQETRKGKKKKREKNLRKYYNEKANDIGWQ